MNFREALFDAVNRCTIGTDAHSGTYLFSIPVSNSRVDYEEYYKITHDQFESFMASALERERFSEECRQRLHDDLLWYQPGTDRGTPL